MKIKNFNISNESTTFNNPYIIINFFFFFYYLLPISLNVYLNKINFFNKKIKINTLLSFCFKH